MVLGERIWAQAFWVALVTKNVPFGDTAGLSSAVMVATRPSG